MQAGEPEEWKPDLQVEYHKKFRLVIIMHNESCD